MLVQETVSPQCTERDGHASVHVSCSTHCFALGKLKNFGIQARYSSVKNYHCFDLILAFLAFVTIFALNLIRALTHSFQVVLHL